METEVQATDQGIKGERRTQRVLPTHHQELLMAHIRSMRTEDCDDFLDHILTQGIENLPGRLETTIYARVTEANTAYTGRTKVMHIGITLSSVLWVAEEQALPDSGASENLIDEESWKTLGTKAFTLPKPVTIYNLDGTENAQGRISTMGKGKQRAIPETHTSPLSELPFSPETSEGHLWPSTLPTSPHLERHHGDTLTAYPMVQKDQGKITKLITKLPVTLGNCQSLSVCESTS